MRIRVSDHHARFLKLFMMCILFLTILGCSKEKTPDVSGDQTNQQPTPTESAQTPSNTADPIKLQVYTKTDMQEEDFQQWLVIPTKNKFPHITLEKVDHPPGKMHELVESRMIPDLIWDGLSNVLQLIELELPKDLNAIAKRHQFDFQLLDPDLMNNVKSYSSQGEILFLPFNRTLFGTHYNKNIFDKFAVAYPSDGMTWEEAITLSKRFNVMDQGVQYQGIDVVAFNRFPLQWSLSHVDPATNKSLVNTEPWKRYFELQREMFANPGGETLHFMGARNMFLGQQRLAMYPDSLLFGERELTEATEAGFTEWDLVTYPAEAGHPGLIPASFMRGFVLPVGGKYEDEAFQVISYLVTDETLQTTVTRAGSITALHRPDVIAQAFEDMPLAQDKNLDEIKKARAASMYPPTLFDSAVHAIYNKYLTEFVKGKDDVNTILRQAEEEANQWIEAERMKK